MSFELEKETSEVSGISNPIMPHLEKSGYYLLTFEGFTIQKQKVTAVLDRYLVKNMAPEDLKKEMLQEIIPQIETRWSEKVDFANKLGCLYLLVFYSYPIDKINVFGLTNWICQNFNLNRDEVDCFFKNTEKLCNK